jgi:hypothetical protein
MKTFTLKDFISYNNPCFICNNIISFSAISSVNVSPLIAKQSIVNQTTINKFQTEILLKTTYNSNLKLIINNTSNQFTSPNLNDLQTYLTSHNIFIKSTCKICHSYIKSSNLNLNYINNFIHPFTINYEHFFINDKAIYTIISDFQNNQTTLIKEKYLNPELPNLNNKPVKYKNMILSAPAVINIPLLPLYKFKSIERIINKINTYLTFS